MEPFAPSDAKIAKTLYEATPTAISRQFLDLLIDHPGEMFDSDQVQQQLEVVDHRDIARTTFALGEIAAANDRKRPWTEGQRGYSMTPDIATMFASLRD